MATHSTNISYGHLSGFAWFKGIFTYFGEIIVKMGENSSRLREIEALQAKSDEELAKLDIKRDDIARHVFRDLLYI